MKFMECINLSLKIALTHFYFTSLLKYLRLWINDKDLLVNKLILGNQIFRHKFACCGINVLFQFADTSHQAIVEL